MVKKHGTVADSKIEDGKILSWFKTKLMNFHAMEKWARLPLQKAPCTLSLSISVHFINSLCFNKLFWTCRCSCLQDVKPRTCGPEVHSIVLNRLRILLWKSSKLPCLSPLFDNQNKP
eukprot:c25156_g1_i2 orf=1090-1440(+)